METMIENASQQVLDAAPVQQSPLRPYQQQAVATLEASSLIHIIAAAARDPSVDIDKMERLWVMHERLTSRAAEEAFNTAMNKAQGEMGRVAADAGNTQTNSIYATYGKLDAAVRPIYTRNGFSISFNEGEDAPEGYARILAYVSHSAGHTRTYKMDMPADGKGAKGGDVMTKTHATGAAHSYGRRYLLKDIFNIAIGEEDNDGNGNQETADNALLERLKVQAEATTTDADAAAFWRTNAKQLGHWPFGYDKFKTAVAAHRTALKQAVAA